MGEDQVALREQPPSTDARGGLRVLFVLRHALNLRNYEALVRDLSARGHAVHLAFTPFPKQVDEALLHRLVAECEDVTWERLPIRSGVWSTLADSARATLDLLRYHEPEYADAHRLRQRAARRFVGPLRAAIAEASWVRDPRRRRLAIRMLRTVERAAPADPAVRAVLERHRPDVLLVTPLVDMTYNQVDYPKAARELGIPSALLVASWDNLTNKGLVQVHPDRVVVWNDAQRREAVDLHGIAPEKVVVTGAQLFDQWFDASPHTTREEFCARVGLDPGADLVLYVCSSNFIAPEEQDFVVRWARQLRASSVPRLREAGLLVRPHPAAAEQWESWVSPVPGLVVWPPAGAQPIDVASKADYFDSLVHADAVVGVNTSAFIEAGIVGRRAMTVLMPEFVGSQSGTLHFGHLAEGGLLETDPDLAAHERRLAAALAASGERTDSNLRFLESFVRPFGLDEPAGPRVVRAVEDLAGTDAGAPLSTRPVLRGALLAIAVLFHAILRPAALTSRAVVRRRRAMSVPADSLGATIVRASTRLARRIVRRLGLAEPVKRHVLPHVVAAAADPPAGTGKESWEQAARRTMRSTVKSVTLSDRPVVVGPWLSEVGFEVLYWVPFLRWLTERHEIDPARLTVVSRGGVASWYDGVSDAYVDIFDVMSPDEFRQLTTDRWADVGGQKQMAFSAWDEVVLRKAGDRLGWDGGPVLHPSLMYSLFRQYWRGRAPINHVLSHTHFDRFATPEDDALVARLPKEFTAVKFYFRPSFPDTPENRRFVQRTVSTLAADRPVVLLNTGLHVDDHPEFAPERAGEVIPLLAGVAPALNLHAQSVAISRATAFVGTYGGLSYLAPAYGVPSLAFASAPEHYLSSHLDLAQRAARATGTTLTVLDVQQADLLSRLSTLPSRVPPLGALP